MNCVHDSGRSGGGGGGGGGGKDSVIIMHIVLKLIVSRLG